MNSRNMDRLLALLATLTIGFFVAVRVVSRPWVLVYAGVVQLVIVAIVVWLAAAWRRDRRDRDDRRQ